MYYFYTVLFFISTFSSCSFSHREFLSHVHLCSWYIYIWYKYHLILSWPSQSASLPHSWEYYKSFFARWNHRVALFSSYSDHPATLPTANAWNVVWCPQPSMNTEQVFQCCALSPPQLFPINKVCAMYPFSSICFSSPGLEKIILSRILKIFLINCLNVRGCSLPSLPLCTYT